MDRPHSHHLRRGRYSESNRAYLITTVTAHREPLFNDLWLGRIVVRSLQYQHIKGYVRSLAFVLMPDHLHWLIELTEKGNLTEVMRVVKSFTAREINRYRQTTDGACWQDGFHDHALRREEDLVAAARYIVANPLRAGIVTKVGDYPLWDAVWL